ncbi:putative quinol monooxygenase [Labilibacter marinus]|uniref:putative quinol monooxygenase n=1 Tax=Labilibacter marinus TaxID=1477105 RepID=UPI00094F812E|nr:putative quinol monooxygenase [Labilibacter marinus]
MIIVAVNFAPKENHQADFKKAFNTLAEKTKVEDGCIAYDIYPKGDSEYFLFEKWETKEKLEAHLATAHIADFMEVSKDWFAKEAELSFYYANEIQLG